MPPRLALTRHLPGAFVTQRPSASLLACLIPALGAPAATTTTRVGTSRPIVGARPVSILSSLSDNPSAYQKRIRRGRGPASGKGKTSGRGHKGQRQHGKVPAGFEGGQTPLHIVKGSRGFVNVHTPEYVTVPISRILSWIEQGRIDPSKPITVRELALSRCVNNIKDGVKLLASSRSHETSISEVPPLAQPLNIVISRASKQAIEAVEAAGGSVLTRFYSRFAIKKIVEGKMDPIYSLQSQLPDGTVPAMKQDEAGSQTELARYHYRLPDATSRRDIQYYRDPENRGYLSYQLKEGENPSLFFKSAEEYAKYAKIGAQRRRRRTATESERLW